MTTPMKRTLRKGRAGEEEQPRSKGALLMKCCLKGEPPFAFERHPLRELHWFAVTKRTNMTLKQTPMI